MDQRTMRDLTGEIEGEKRGSTKWPTKGHIT